MVRWPSGPEKKSDKLIRIPVDGTGRQYTFVQPEDEPNAPHVPSPMEEERDGDIQAKPGQDSGLRAELEEIAQITDAIEEELEEEIAQITDRIKGADPNDGAREREVTVVEVRPERDPGLREEQDEETAQIIDKTKATDPNDEVTEQEVTVTEVISGPQQREEPKEEIAQIKAAIKTIDFNNGVTMDFALIPAGEFMMDSSPDQRDPNTAAAHMVRISKPFYMSLYEVTQQQYEEVMSTNPSRFIDPNRPVETVSWRDAQRFCRNLSSIDSGRYRLATEAEWEYACRAGTTTAYYWGDGFDDRYAWAITNSKSATHEVGTRLPNAWGLHDMAGNVAEWCQDWHGPYDPNSAEQVDPKGPSEGVYRILRGGSWGHPQASCQSGHRNWHTPDHAYDDCGIRIVLELE